MRLVILWCLLNLVIVVLGKQCAVSQYQNALKRAFIRRKRLVVFPNYCAMKLTVAVGKALIARHPTGNFLSLEVSVYYPLPTSLEEWYPRRYRKKNKVTVKPKKDNGGINDIPSIWSRTNGPIPVRGSQVWLKNASIYGNKFLTSSKPRYNDVMKSSRYPQRKWSKVNGINIGLKSQNVPTFPTPLKNYKNFPKMHNSIDEADLFEGNQKFYRAHRDRRDLYNYIENVGWTYGFNLKACILRAICETKRYLLPRGISLIQDIIRIAFTTPSERIISDEYSRVQNSEQCEGVFDGKCPFSIIDMALFPDKINKMK